MVERAAVFPTVLNQHVRSLIITGIALQIALHHAVSYRGTIIVHIQEHTCNETFLYGQIVHRTAVPVIEQVQMVTDVQSFQMDVVERALTR